MRTGLHGSLDPTGGPQFLAEYLDTNCQISWSNLGTTCKLQSASAVGLNYKACSIEYQQTTLAGMASLQHAPSMNVEREDIRK
jgi:hypothetical protein